MTKAIFLAGLLLADASAALGQSQVDPPIFSPAASTYASGQTVTITSATPGATIRYTTDGSTPTETNGTVYAGSPMAISTSSMLKAIAYGNNFGDSTVTSGLYTITSSPAACLNVIYNFTGLVVPSAALVQGSDGNFYGTTGQGGSANDGTIFKVTPTGIFTTLVSFNGANGAFPFSSALVEGSDGNFYGTTQGGGSSQDGTVFKMTPAGVLSTLISFNGANGDEPMASLVQGSDGNFYGTTFLGGSGGEGTVFMMTPAGALTTLVSFNGSNGAYPSTALVQGSDGNFYGTTESGGIGGSGHEGTVFKVTPTGVLTTLVSFNGTNGAFPQTALVQGSDGNFYGTTIADGNDEGTVFKMTPAGILTTLVLFNGANGVNPEGELIQGSDGNFYGTTNYGGSGNIGTIFKLTPAGVLTTLVSFTGPNGTFPVAALVQGKDGNFYGTTQDGGISNDGVIFQLVVLPEVATPVFSPAGGTYASTQTVTITSATSGATIRYTTDGSMPSETNGAIDAGSPITISTTTTLRAIAYAPGFTDSAVTSATYTINLPPGWTVKDFNGDGTADILWRDPATGGFGIWSMAGTTPTGFAPMGNVPTPWSIVAVGDFNHDGRADILWRNPTTGEVGVMLMNGSSFGNYVGLGVVDSSWSVVGIGDFNKDGQTDILWENASGTLGFWTLNGTTVTGFIPIGTLPTPWTIVGVGDFNGDSKPDLLWRDPTTGNLIVGLMDGAAVTNFEAVGNVQPPWTVAGIADFNGDGSPDLLLYDPTTGNVGVFIMNGVAPANFIFLGSVPAPWQPID